MSNALVTTIEKLTVKLGEVEDERDRAMQAAVLLRRWLRRLLGGGGDFAKAQAEEAMKACDFLDDWLDGTSRTGT